MKLSILLPLIAAVALAGGCSSARHHTTTPAAAKAPAATEFNTAALVTAFQNSDLASNQLVQGVIAALSSKDFTGALSSLRKLDQIPGLTAAQGNAVDGLIAAVSTKAR